MSRDKITILYDKTRPIRTNAELLSEAQRNGVASLVGRQVIVPVATPPHCLYCSRPLSIPSSAPAKRFCGVPEGDPSGSCRNAWWTAQQREVAKAKHQQQARENVERESTR